jgi:hypothetical protein
MAKVQLTPGPTTLATTRCGRMRWTSASRSAEGSRIDTWAWGRCRRTEKASASAYMRGSMAITTRGAGIIPAPSQTQGLRARRSREDRLRGARASFPSPQVRRCVALDSLPKVLGSGISESTLGRERFARSFAQTAGCPSLPKSSEGRTSSVIPEIPIHCSVKATLTASPLEPTPIFS